jgi:RNA polymerase sigma factor (sigma-70 family)
LANGAASEVIQHLRRTVLLREGAGLTDGQLLEVYVSRRDGTALAALVRRHGPMVWGVCRRVLHNQQDAEDAFQATFLVLMRRASALIAGAPLANWLHGVARQTARKARATVAQRRGREMQVVQLPELPGMEGSQADDLRALLDEEIGRLPEKYRAVLVLCDLEGKTRKETAQELGCPEGTVAGRLARARAMLAVRLTRRGMALSAGVLAMALGHNATWAGVPPALIAATIEAVTAAGVVSAQVAELVKGVLKIMLITKLQCMAMVMLVVLGTLAGGGLMAQLPATTGYRASGTAPSALPPPPAPRVPRPVDDAALEVEGSGQQQYVAIFGKTLGIVGQSFHTVSYANHFDGRMEAGTVAPADQPEAIIHRGVVQITTLDEGRFYISVRVYMGTAKRGLENAKERDWVCEKAFLRCLREELSQKKKSAAFGAPAQPAVTPVLGPKAFRDGDVIEITGVRSTSEKFEQGDTVTVRGRVRLATENQAQVSLFVTQTEGDGHEEIDPAQTMTVKRGNSDFELKTTIKHRGYLHVTLYDHAGRSFGGVYFGTAEQMKRIREEEQTKQIRETAEQVKRIRDWSLDPKSSPSPTRKE